MHSKLYIEINGFAGFRALHMNVETGEQYIPTENLHNSYFSFHVTLKLE